MSVITGCYPHTRMRRLRKNSFIRDLIAENTLTIDDLICPVFVMEDASFSVTIDSMPGVSRIALSKLLQEVEVIVGLGIKAIALFPVVSSDKKTSCANEAYSENSLMFRAVRALKQNFPELIVIVDVALDPYTTHGQDGLLDDNGNILNDETNEVLVKQALAYAVAGADCVAPSDMMDGRIGMIRSELERHQFFNVQILSYAVKYASTLYSPFRDAVASKINLAGADKRSYQMNIANSNEALREAALDIKEGADIIMIKPGLFYLDVLARVKQEFNVPTFVYQVSAEYSMVQLAINNQLLDKNNIIMESLLCFKRAGADSILTYFAKDAARYLRL